MNYVLREVALGSVSRSISDPRVINTVNISGFINMLVVARDVKIGSFTSAVSSSTYGDHSALPKVEEDTVSRLFPYADFVSKKYSFF